MKDLHIHNVSYRHYEENTYSVWAEDDNYPPQDQATRIATARLFKASPKMLAALHAIHANPDGARIIAAAAIKEATGE